MSDFQWHYTWQFSEWILSIFFVLACASYLVRYFRLARQLKEDFSRVFFKIPIRILYFGLIIVAVLGPSFGYGKRTLQTIGKDIYIAIDLSASMNATDIVPTRLEKIKFELKNIVEKLPADRIGLVIFSSEAFLQCPLTFDKSALLLFIQSLNTDLVPSKSTNLHAPLQTILNKMMAENYQKESKMFAKIVLLISDGEDFAQGYENILPELKQKGIKVFTLGIGTQQGSKVPLAQGGYQKDENGEAAITKLNYATMNQIAEKTQGQFFEISKNKNETNELIKTLQQLKGQRMDVREVDISTNKYLYFLWVAMGLLIIDILLTINLFKL
ncbi:MAG: VWA domain-containing protein [Cytophagales bacterium]|nr:MAG: VWA domain-containing protein [Cytophagales bacterium]